MISQLYAVGKGLAVLHMGDGGPDRTRVLLLRMMITESISIAKATTIVIAVSPLPWCL
jgi:hypothetical protein